MHKKIQAHLLYISLPDFPTDAWPSRTRLYSFWKGIFDAPDKSDFGDLVVLMDLGDGDVLPGNKRRSTSDFEILNFPLIIFPDNTVAESICDILYDYKVLLGKVVTLYNIK